MSPHSATLGVVPFALLALLVTHSEAFSNPDTAKRPGGNLPKDAKLRIGVIRRVECERKSQHGDEMSMHYTGWLRQNGVVFDSSVSRGDPFSFTLGKGTVIKGWENGLLDMCVGERRRLTIPADLGYGSYGSGSSIPPDATIMFDVELLRIKAPDGKEEL
eukprot:m.101296 g.101296  ORF g.101296 m.101296 type:complete len:160 (+) comp20740_c1_seq1:155-634(+)